jgi:26S proteasome regulatory subunit N1
LLYSIAISINPRFLLTVDEELNKINVSVRVGQAVDTVAQAGRPKTITGFQTHNTPVIIQSNERVELGTAKYIPATSILEDVVILKKNKDFVEE